MTTMDGLPPARPHPVRLRRTLRLHEVDTHRRIGCAHYEECLRRSAQHTWLSFTCVRCFAFRPRYAELDEPWSFSDSVRFLAGGLGNRPFPRVEYWLATQPGRDRAQV